MTATHRVVQRTLTRSLSQPETSGPTLLALPHAGSVGDVFRGWATALGSQGNVWTLDYPGRRTNADLPWGSLAELADSLAREFADEDNLIVFGHSMGAILGFEVAARLERKGQTPRRLVVSASPTPRVRAGRVPPESPTRRAEEIMNNSGMAKDLLHDAEFTAWAGALLAADLEVLDRHRPTDHILRVPLLSLASFADRVCSPAEVAGWADYSDHPLGIHYYPGDHMFPYQHIERALEDCLSS